MGQLFDCLVGYDLVAIDVALAYVIQVLHNIRVFQMRLYECIRCKMI